MTFFRKAMKNQLTKQTIKSGDKKKNGFTLIELLIAMSILSIIALSVRPAYTEIITKSKEGALKKNLYIIREALESYYTDHMDENNHNYYPKKLSDLTTEKNKYLRYIPEDPFTEKKDWVLIYIDSQSKEKGIFDIKSNSNLTGSNNVLYKDW